MYFSSDILVQKIFLVLVLVFSLLKNFSFSSIIVQGFTHNFNSDLVR